MAKLSPVFNDQTVDTNGNPAVGYKLFTYAAGSATKQSTFSDEAGTVPNSNPIILNADGWPTQGPIWLTEGQAYKFVLALPDDNDPPTSPVKTIDNVSGVGDNTVSISQWVDAGLAPTYVSSESFTLIGDQTSDFQVGRRVRLLIGVGTVYGYINTSAYTTLTTVTVVLDSGELDPGLSAVSLGLLTPENTSLPIETDANFRVSGSSDRTKRIAFEVDELSSNTTRTYKAPDTNGTLAIVETLPETQTSRIQPISASVASNALTITLGKTVIDFRSSPITSGVVNTRTVASPITLLVSSGSTLGTANGVSARLAVIAIDNAGTIELAVMNIAGGANLDETGLITTTAEGGAGGADSALVAYSANARTNVPYRVVGYINSTQTTAGTWAAIPTTVQGAGGQSMIATALNAAGSAPLFGIRAWVTFNASTLQIFASGNVSSVTSNGIGDKNINFTVPLPDGDYAVSGVCNYTTSGSGASTNIELVPTSPPTASACRIYIHRSGVGAVDPDRVTVVFVR